MRTEALLTPHMLASLQPKEKDYTVFDAQCPTLAIRIQPGGSKSWVTWQRSGGKTRRVTLGSLDDLDIESARGSLLARNASVSVPKASRCPTFANLTRSFLKAKEDVYRPTTLSCMRAYIDSQLRPAFGKKRVDKITTPDFAAWFYEYSRERPGGANHAALHFTTILNWGKANGHLPHDLPNPSSPIRKNRRVARGQMLNSNDLKRLFEILNDPPPRAGDAAHLIALILLTGCRSGEIMRLKWEEVKADRLDLAQTKTGARTVLLNAHAVSMLKELKDERNSDFVFPSPYDLNASRQTLTGPWNRIKELAELPPALRLHDLPCLAKLKKC